MNNLLEQTVLYSLIHGSIQPIQLKPHISLFSKTGKAVYQSVNWLLGRGQTPPFAINSVELTCVEQFGTSQSETEAYCHELKYRVSGKEILEVLKGASQKLKLLDLQQAVVKQMTDGDFDPSVFDTIIKESTDSEGGLLSLSEESQEWGMDDDFERPTGIRLGDRLRSLQEHSGGLTGFWVVGGTPGVGKSTLSWQLALIAGQERPVLYYDLENTKRVLFRRTVKTVDGDVGKAHETLRRIYVRNNPREIFGEVQQLGEPGVIIIDSLQKLPSNVHTKRESLEEWLAKLDSLKHEGHTIVVVSQLNREEGSYKGTNDIEHTADFGIKMESNSSNVSFSNVYIEKNRHGPQMGFVCQLRRENTWLFTEM